MTERTIIRTPNHLGDLVMALPALAAAPDADLIAVRWLTPLLEMARAESGSAGRVLALDRGARGMLRAATQLRAARYDRGVLLPTSASSAMLFTVGRVRVRRGLPTDGRAALLTEPVKPRPGEPVHRAAEYHHLVTGAHPESPPVPRLPVSGEARRRWRALEPGGTAPLVGIFPGSNASSRRWAAGRFAELAARFRAAGLRVAVFGSAAERHLTSAVAEAGAEDLGGRTDLPVLAAGLQSCHLLVTNDSGPMHLAAAVGTRTVSLWGPGDPRRTRPLGEKHRMLWGGDLPCIPCVKNECPRRGVGYQLPEAERECMRLISVESVAAAALQPLGRITN